MAKRQAYPSAITEAEARPRPKRSAASAEDLRWKPAICGICPAGCWVEVGLRDGKMVDIRADTTHQLGMICRRGRCAPQIVYSEHRLRHPMRRKTSKRDPAGPHARDPVRLEEFEPISWDTAYEEIVAHLQRIKRESGPEAVAIYTGRGAFELSLCDLYQPKGVAVSSASNVLFPFGSPNTMGGGALCYVSFAMIAPHVTMGRMLINMFTDIENSELLIVWGTNPATDSPPLDMLRLEAAAQRGAEVVVIDPRRTETVKRTGAEWIPIRPGTDGALALSMIGVMVEEELYEEDFAENWCHGFDDLCRYVQHFPPEAVSEITGVPAETIRRLARRICHATGAAPVMYSGLEYSNTGVQSIRAVHTLFALAGQLDVPGGIGLGMDGTQFPINKSCNLENPDLERAVATSRFPTYTRYRHEAHGSGIVPAALRGDPYPLRGLIVHGTSLLTAWPQAPLWRAALAKLDFQVCIDRQLTADMAYADIVLPATTMFEIDSYITYGPIFRLREKVIEPVGEARSDYLIMAELARRLGYGHLFPQTEEDVVRLVLEGSGFTLEQVRQAGGWVKIPTPVMEYKKWEKGGLRPDGRPGFDTPTGKFEIHSTILEEDGYEPLPKYTEPTEGPLSRPDLAKRFPLIFNSGARPHTDFHSQHHGIRCLNKDAPEPTCDISVADAEARGIENGDLVEVRTARGAVPFRARVTEDIVTGAIECSQGGGTPVGPRAWQVGNVNELTDNDNYDEVSGFPVYKCLLCDVVKVSDATAETRGVGQVYETDPETWAATAMRERSAARRIYLDNNATAPLADEVREAMQPYLEERHGNPSGIYGAGRRAKEAIENARRQVSGLLHARPRRIVFTGGGSESDNLAIKGAVAARRDRGRHIITSAIEHPAVLETCRYLERDGYRVTCLDVDRQGRISPAALAEAIDEETVLVSLMMANNEIGTIEPVRELCAVARERGVLFHTDAVQAIGRIGVDVEEIDADLLSISAHKFHGPKGVGALYVRKGVALEPLIHGGKQEGGLRGGTENVAAIVGMGRAADLAHYGLKDAERIRALRDMLERGIRELVPGAELNGHPTERLPNTLNLTLPRIRGESLVIALDQHGVSLSSGSACKSGSPEPTHVLLAIGRTEAEAHCAVRFSLSRETSEKEIRETLEALRYVLEEMDSTVRFLPCK
ncbi:MAG: aminotransferase class V-fold PLP-dependent enzyme [Candidatus Eisenbacteria bacterium]|nr:aminotransferase class V-fold PLP-dependent enzyme [Candidatus Eisenbacteria bacterium]